MVKLYSGIVLLSGIMWGVIGIFVRELRKFGFTSVQISALRWIFSAIVVLAAVLLHDRKKMKIKLNDIWMFAFMGICSLLAMSTFYFMCMERTSVAVSDVFLYTSPIWVMILSAIFLKEKITAEKIISIMFVFIGCTLVSGVFGQDNGGFSVTGVLFGALSGLAYSLYGVVGKNILKKYDRATLTVYNFIFAAVGALFIINVPQTAKMIATDVASLKAIILLAVIGTVIPFFMYTTSLKYLSPSRVAVLSCIEPVSATVTSIFVIGERMSLLQFAGIVFIISTIAYMQIASGEKSGNSINAETKFGRLVK